MIRNVPRHLRTTLTALSALITAGAAQAHEGHGLPGSSHWHGTDTLGFLLVLALGGVALWLGGRK